MGSITPEAGTICVFVIYIYAWIYHPLCIYYIEYYYINFFFISQFCSPAEGLQMEIR